MRLVETDVAGRPVPDRLLGRAHGLAHGGVAHRTELIGDCDHRRQVRLHRLGAVLQHPLDGDRAIGDPHGAGEGDGRNAQKLRDSGTDDAGIPVRRLASRENQVHVANGTNGLGKGASGSVAAALVEGRVAEQHRVVRTQGQRRLDDRAGALGPDGDHGNFGVRIRARRVADAQRRLHRLLVERADHRRQAGDRDHPLRLFVDAEDALRNLRVLNLLHADDDFHGAGAVTRR